MGTKLTHASRTELADSMRKRYQSSSGKTKKLILSEFIAATGCHPSTRYTCSTRKTPLRRRA